MFLLMIFDNDNSIHKPCHLTDSFNSLCIGIIIVSIGFVMEIKSKNYDGMDNMNNGHCAGRT